MRIARGFTLVEFLVALGIALLFITAVTGIFLTASKSQTQVFDQLEAQGEARRALQDFVNEMRSANYSSLGAYPIESATTTQIVFFSNIDSDSFLERIRYYISSSTLKRGVTKPTGTPLAYVTSTERLTDVVHYIVNTTSSPVFSYYDQNYAGTSTAMTSTASISSIRMVGVQLKIDKNPQKSPVVLTVQTQVELRNLKSN